MWQRTFLVFQSGPYRMAIGAQHVEQVRQLEEGEARDPQYQLELARYLYPASRAAEQSAFAQITFLMHEFSWVVDSILGIWHMAGDALFPVPRRMYGEMVLSEQVFLHEDMPTFVVDHHLTGYCLSLQEQRETSVVKHLGVEDEQVQFQAPLLALELLSGERIAIPLAQTERFIQTDHYYRIPGMDASVQGGVIEQKQFYPIVNPSPQEVQLWPLPKDGQLFLIVHCRGESIAIPIKIAGEVIFEDNFFHVEDKKITWKDAEYLIAGVDNW